MSSLSSQNCTNVPASTATDAGVAGTGVLLSFIVTAILAVLLSSYIIFSELRHKHESRIPRKLLMSFSDQQIITGIGIQSVGLAKMHSMVPYHFFIIWMLSLLSNATHLASLLALVNDFKRDWVLRWLRQVLMFVNLVLSCVYGVYVLRGVMKGLKPTLPIACAWQLSAGEAAGNVGISVAGTIGVIAGNGVVFVLAVWYLHSKNQRWLKGLQVVGLFFLTALGAGAAIRVILLSQAFGKPSVELEGMGEKEWSFGQLLSILMLVLPLISALEIFRGELRVPPPVCGDNDSLKTHEHELFQPNPFWGSNTHLVRR